MKKLVANYEIELEFPIVVKRSEKTKPSYKVQVYGFDVTLELSTTRFTATKHKGEKYYTVPYTHFVLTVGRLDTPPPHVVPDEKGIKDYSIQSDYFDKRTPEFAKAAAEVANRAIRYFKYKLWQPLLFEIEERHFSLMNPKWTDEKGEEVGKGTGYFRVVPIPGMERQDFGTIKFEKKHDTPLGRTLKSSIRPTLTEEIAYDAQSAIYSNNFRRAVLELALSTEIAIKQALFGSASSGGLAFEYLEDKGKIHIQVTELIDSVALQVFGSSFKKTYPHDFTNIDHLFRCRNKVAHRGESIFRDDSRKLHQVDLKTLKAWWSSSGSLNKWLDKHARKP